MPAASRAATHLKRHLPSPDPCVSGRGRATAVRAYAADDRPQAHQRRPCHQGPQTQARRPPGVGRQAGASIEAAFEGAGSVERQGLRDPAAVVDLDPFTPVLRVSAAVTTGELLGLLHETGCEVPPNAVRPRPSVCCGGCGG